MSTNYKLQTTNSTIFSGVQPSGVIHLGNYLGAIKQWVALQADNTAYFCIVDLHAITVPYEADKLPAAVLDAAALYLAAGLESDKSTIFVQSHVPAHAELAWLLSTITPLGELSRMTQFKEKEAKRKQSANLGLFAYPVLQAADILLYQTNIVPVGEDQVQHIELARNIAKRFNNKFGEVFTIPEAYVNGSSKALASPKPQAKAGRIMSLTDPTKKMSKSDHAKSYIALTDDPDTIRAKISNAVTETEPVFSFTKSGPAVKNLLTIYQAFSEEKPEAVEQQFAGGGYHALKQALAELLIAKLTPIRERYTMLRADESALQRVLTEGKERAATAAESTFKAVKNKMGLR